MLQPMRPIVDLRFDQPRKPAERERRRRFLILCKAFSLGVYSTDATMAELLAMAGSVSDQTIDDTVIKIIDAEGINVKHTIR